MMEPSLILIYKDYTTMSEIFPILFFTVSCLETWKLILYLAEFLSEHFHLCLSYLGKWFSKGNIHCISWRALQSRWLGLVAFLTQWVRNLQYCSLKQNAFVFSRFCKSDVQAQPGSSVEIHRLKSRHVQSCLPLPCSWGKTPPGLHRLSAVLCDRVRPLS